MEYAHQVRDTLWAHNFQVEVEETGRTLNKMIREAQLAQFNYILVVGNKEAESNSVNIRSRSNEMIGTKTLDECIAMFDEFTANHQ